MSCVSRRATPGCFRAEDSQYLTSLPLCLCLERLTKPSLDEAPGDEGGSEGREGEVDVGALFVADRQASELPEPSERPLRHPAVPRPTRPRRTRPGLQARIGVS
jgi:hypothetical protein